MIETKKDGRTIRTGKDYTAFRRALWEAQLFACSVCGRYTHLNVDLERDDSFHVHHYGGRGMGGGKRDDTFDSCTGKCGKCHREGHNQQ